MAREAINLEVDDAYMVAFWDGPSRTAAAYFANADWPTDFDASRGPLTFDAVVLRPATEIHSG